MAASSVGRKADNRPPTSSMSYNVAPEPLQVPRTPLESRQGYHPKTDDRLLWKSPPSRQLTRQKRVEYESDVRERFYDDYLGPRTSGDANNEVMTTSELSKLKFDPNLYRVNAYQGLAYDPMRPVPRGLDLNVVLEQEKVRDRHRQVQTRQRRLSDSSIGASTYYHPEQYNPSESFQQPLQYSGQRKAATLPPLQRPRSALQQSMDEVVAPDMVPAMESWLLNADKKDQDVAAGFFRTLSSQGQRPDPASKASLHHSRVRSAVMTPSKKERQGQIDAQHTFQQLSRETDKLGRPTRKSEPSKKYRLQRSSSDKMAAKGSMTFAANKQLPSHFTVHPDWTSESLKPSKRK